MKDLNIRPPNQVITKAKKKCCRNFGQKNCFEQNETVLTIKAKLDRHQVKKILHTKGNEHEGEGWDEVVVHWVKLMPVVASNRSTGWSPSLLM